MGIFERAHQVIASNFNSLIGRFEDPARDVASILTEMKEQIHAAERELIRVIGSKKRSEAELTELEQQIRTWENRAALAVKHQQDGLAREALAMKQKLVQKRESMVQLRAEQQQAALAMKSEIERMRGTHRDYDSRKGTLGVQVSQSRAGGGATGLGATPEQRPFDDFERIESSIDQAEAEASAVAEVEQLLDRTPLGGMSKRELESQFEDLERAAPSAAATSPGEATQTSPDVVAEVAKARVRVEP
jgi:phage shock protein A